MSFFVARWPPTQAAACRICRRCLAASGGSDYRGRCCLRRPPPATALLLLLCVGNVVVYN